MKKASPPGGCHFSLNGGVCSRQKAVVRWQTWKLEGHQKKSSGDSKSPNIAEGSVESFYDNLEADF